MKHLVLFNDEFHLWTMPLFLSGVSAPLGNTQRHVRGLPRSSGQCSRVEQESRVTLKRSVVDPLYCQQGGGDDHGCWHNHNLTSSLPRWVQLPTVGTTLTHAGTWTTQRICAILSVNTELCAMTHPRHSGSCEPLTPARRPNYTPHPMVQFSIPTACKALTVTRCRGSPLFLASCPVHGESRRISWASFLWVLCLGSLSSRACDKLRGWRHLTFLNGCLAHCWPCQPGRVSAYRRIFPLVKSLGHTCKSCWTLYWC